MLEQTPHVYLHMTNISHAPLSSRVRPWMMAGDDLIQQATKCAAAVEFFFWNFGILEFAADDGRWYTHSTVR